VAEGSVPIVRERSSGGLDQSAGASLDWIGEPPAAVSCRPSAFFRRPLARARAPVASDPKGEVIERRREFLNDEVW
jgi:hypothetical protein